MFNPNIEENRISLAYSICEEIEELYQILVHLKLSQRTLGVHTKVAFDGTKSALFFSQIRIYVTSMRLEIS